jgi:hypothetical protein
MPFVSDIGGRELPVQLISNIKSQKAFCDVQNEQNSTHDHPIDNLAIIA